MKLLQSKLRRLAFAVTLAPLFGGTARAHFPWLATDDEAHAILWFGESLADRTYHMPEKIAAVQLHRGDQPQPLTLGAIRSDDLVGVRSEESLDRSQELHASVTYGLYHGTKLTYHVEHLPQRDPKSWPTEARSGAALQTIITPAAAGGIDVTVLAEGQPLDGADVKLFCSDGHEEGSATTDEKGRVSFTARQVEEGLNAIMVGVTTKQTGQYDGGDYASTSDYLTATFFAEEPAPKASGAEAGARANEGAMIVPARLPDLPEELTSFGAAVLDGKVYVYGGHTGDAHAYSRDQQSNRLWSLDLQEGATGKWRKLAEGPVLQGLALVPHGERLIRIGGFSAMNEVGEDHRLVSRSDVAAFDPASGTWAELPSLPEPRSSLDAAVLGDRVFVFGGWTLDGDSDNPTWLTSSYSLDLTDPSANWRALTPMPVRRRALAVAAHQGKLYLIGGMNAEGGPTTDVLVYDPSTDAWSSGPALPGEGMAGFGSAAFESSGQLIVSVYDGNVFRLSDDGRSWETIGKLETGRFFHRMLPVAESELLILGGANMKAGKFTKLLTIKLASH